MTEQFDELHWQSEQLLKEAADARMQTQFWSVLFLQASLVFIMLFLDLSLFGLDRSQPVLGKAYGLILLALCGVLCANSKKEQVASRIACSTIFLSLILSLSRLGYGESQNLYQTIPLLFLIALSTSQSWSLLMQIIVVWSMVAGDLIVRVAGWMSLHEVSFDGLGIAMQQYRGEIAIIATGTLISVIVVRLRQDRRLSELFSATQQQKANNGSKNLSESTTLSRYAENVFEPERLERLAFWQFVLGIISSAVSSALLFRLNDQLWWAAFTTWMFFSIIWGLLTLSLQKKIASHHIWALGLFNQLVLTLWPCILLLLVPDMGLLWIYWPLAVLLGVGMIPWGGRELLPLLLAVAVVGGEIAVQLFPNMYVIALFVCSTLLALLWNLQHRRRLQERCLLLSFEEIFESANDEQQVMRQLADYISQLCNAYGVGILPSGSEAELFITPHLYNIAADSLPSGRIDARAREVSAKHDGVKIQIANWLPTDIRVVGTQFGAISISNCLIIRLEQRNVEHSLYFFLRNPFMLLLQGRELATVSALARSAWLQLARCELQDSLNNMEQDFAKKGADREFELSALVHDINNTVQDLTLLCESIVEDGDAEGQSETVVSRIKRIEGIARSVATVVSDAKRKRELEQLDDLSPRELVEVTGVLDEVCSFAKLRAERKRIVVEQDYLKTQRNWVKVSVREHLETILRNLFNNATTYSPAGSVIRIALHVNEENISIEISDTGPGLTAEECETIFHAGVRGRHSDNLRGGLGVGLAESRRVAESAGGSLTAESDGPGYGSTFTLRLPRHDAPLVNSHSDPWALLVDDEPPVS